MFLANTEPVSLLPFAHFVAYRTIAPFPIDRTGSYARNRFVLGATRTASPRSSRVVQCLVLQCHEGTNGAILAEEQREG